MLTGFHIQNFRLCKDVLVEGLGSVAALVGPNGSGKSTILQAISRIAATASSTAYPMVLIDHRFFSHLPLDVTLNFEIDGGEYEYRYSVEFAEQGGTLRPLVKEHLIRAEGRGGQQSLMHREGGAVSVGEAPKSLSIGELAAALPATMALLPGDDPLASAIKPVLSFLSAIRYYPLDEPTVASVHSGPISCADYEKWEATYDATRGASGSVLMRIIYMWRKKQDELAALKSLLGPNGLELINDIQVDRVTPDARNQSTAAASENAYYFVTFLPNRGHGQSSDLVLADGLSHGTRRVLRMLVAILFDENSVVLLEQPEDSLHQGLTRALIGLLRQNAAPAQLIMASHSSVVLNTLRPEEIRLVSLHKGFTQVRPLTRKEVEAAAEFVNEQGPLYDFLETVQQED